MSALDHLLTPPEIADAFDVFGGVGLDPCSNPYSLVPARTRIFDARESWTWPDAMVQTGLIVGDGLAFNWNGHGLVFVNHPYSNSKVWLAKAASEGDEVIVLTMSMTADRWWHDSIFAIATDLLFWKGRLKYYEHDDKLGNHGIRPCKHGARFSSALIYYGPRPKLFREVFDGCGWFPPTFLDPAYEI
jgi:hypothetical protein